MTMLLCTNLYHIAAQKHCFLKRVSGRNDTKGALTTKNISVAREINALVTLTFLHSIQDEQRTNKSAVARR